jgi:hypothetical protein
VTSTASIAPSSTRTHASPLHVLVESLSGAGFIAAMTVLHPFVRGWYSRWGASPSEACEPLPGDDLVPAPRIQSTRAITIDAPAQSVWGWVAQIGQERAGLYSYEELENLVGCGMHNADRIDPDQELRTGDRVRLGPKGYPLFVVEKIERGRALVLLGADPKTERTGAFREPMPASYACSTWVFVVRSLGPRTTRLIVRNRLDYRPANLANNLIWGLSAGPIEFVMERKMLRGIRQRAEALSGVAAS